MLAVDIAKQIIGDALGKDDKVYMELAYNALKLVQGHRKIQLKVSSEDFPYILKNKNELLSRLKGIDDIQIIEDSYLLPLRVHLLEKCPIARLLVSISLSIAPIFDHSSTASARLNNFGSFQGA